MAGATSSFGEEMTTSWEFKQMEPIITLFYGDKEKR
jgi:hypothetical protein